MAGGEATEEDHLCKRKDGECGDIVLLFIVKIRIMKKLIYFIFCFFIIVCLEAQPLNIMTFNIRYNTAADSLNAWPYRKDKAAGQILFHDAHIIGVQEALHNQMLDLQSQLTRFKYVGVGRDDGHQKGEYAAIFYDTIRMQLIQSQTFWLSEQPMVPGSKGWDAANTRIVTWAKFKDRKTNKIFYHLVLRVTAPKFRTQFGTQNEEFQQNL